MARLELVSPLPLIECQRLLGLALKESDEIDGSINGTNLVARKRISYRNSFQIRLSAILVDEGGHTRIYCRFGMHPFVIVFLVVWFGFVLLAGSGGIPDMIITLLSDLPSTLRGFAEPLIPAVMLLFGIALVGIGRALSAGDRLVLTDFIRKTLNAAEVG